MKRWGVLVVSVALCVTALVYFGKSSPTTIEINGHPINVEVVDTPEAREKGLSGRDGLDQDEGMLFVFQNDDTHTFWMKGMRFSIDIVWISFDSHIIDIRENVSPNTYPTTFSPRIPARYVLELPANTVKRLNVRVGDIVRL